MTSSNYLNNAVDLDSTYIVNNDPNYQGIQSAVTSRKTVMFGQQILSQTYPIGNLNNAINYAQSIPSPIVDQDSVNITGVTPTAVFYRSRANTSQSTVRGNFNLLENIPQTTPWQTTPSLGNSSTPVQSGSRPVTGVKLHLITRAAVAAPRGWLLRLHFKAMAHYGVADIIAEAHWEIILLLIQLFSSK